MILTLDVGGITTVALPGSALSHLLKYADAAVVAVLVPYFRVEQCWVY